YLYAKEDLLNLGVLPLDLQTHKDPWKVSESEFLAELAFVIMSVGMRESVVTARFPAVRRAFLDFSSCAAVTESAATFRVSALRAFHHRGKIDAIIGAAEMLAEIGFDRWRLHAFSDPSLHFRDFSYVGPAAAAHLAKNLGFDCCKADRHLLRLT